MNKNPKVLLIEDDISSVKIYSNKLKISNFDVSVATTGDEGLRKAQVEQTIVKTEIILIVSFILFSEWFGYCIAINQRRERIHKQY